MDYEEKYKEALERAKKELQTCGSTNCDAARQIYRLFPELKESEDEKIRKELTELISCMHDADTRKERWIAWLEKQGEQKSFDFENANIQQKDFAPKVESRFKDGDWIVSNEKLYVYQIEEINEFVVKVREINGETFVVNVNCLKDAHLWTIKDAKDGDVLYSPCCKLLWIYKDEKTCHVGSNLNYNSGSIVINKPICIPTDVQPATKEQCDFLFQKMKEAGYEWDADKKELKKIRNKIEIPFGAKDSELQEVTYYIPKGFYAKIEDDKVVIKKGEKPTAWSEEDEVGWTNTMIMIKEVASNHYTKDSVKLVIDWLKSLKNRCTWKPSDEQIDVLLSEVSAWTKGCPKQIVLESLYNDLLKLKGE